MQKPINSKGETIMKHPIVYVCHTLTMLSSHPCIQANDLVCKLTATESNTRLIGRAFALQMREKHGKTSVRVAEECQLAR